MNMAYVRCDWGVVYSFGREVRKLAEVYKIPLTP